MSLKEIQEAADRIDRDENLLRNIVYDNTSTTITDNDSNKTTSSISNYNSTTTALVLGTLAGLATILLFYRSSH